MGLRLECCTLDAAFFPENNAETYGRYVSVAIEHENDYSTTVEEMYKLQRFNAPLSVLITYPGRPEIGDRLLKKYAAIIKAADVFENATSHRRQLMIFGYKGPEWRAFVYADSAFSSLDAMQAHGS